MVVLTMALGIGASTAIFSLVEGVLLRPLPFHDPHRLVSLNDQLEGEGVNGVQGVNSTEVDQYVRGTNSFASLGGYTTTSYELSGRSEPAQVNAARLYSGGMYHFQKFPTAAADIEHVPAPGEIGNVDLLSRFDVLIGAAKTLGECARIETGWRG